MLLYLEPFVFLFHDLSQGVIWKLELQRHACIHWIVMWGFPNECLPLITEA